MSLTIKLSKEIYPREAIIKAANNFLNEYHIYLDTDEQYFLVEFSKKVNEPTNNILSEFKDEVLLQTTRFQIMNDTKNVRELILGRALASTVITDTDSGFVDDSSYQSDEILVDWFEKNDSN